MENNINNNPNDGDMFQYIDIDDALFTFNNDEQSPLNPQNQINQVNNSEQKITTKASFACFRVLVLYFVYIIENRPLTPFLQGIITFLLVHEVLALSNFIGMKSYIFLYRCFWDIRTFQFPSVFLLVDTFNNLIFFTWFLYGNLCILTNKNGVENSLKENVLMTYYITILLLLGFFIFAKFIFYIIFFISFCPCISYVMFTEMREEYRRKQRERRIEEKMVPITYEEYIQLNGAECDSCIICAELFKEKSAVVQLPCSVKHLFHEACIKQWIKNKTICPICRTELKDED